MSALAPFTWLVTSLVVTIGYTLLFMPTMEHRLRGIGWGTAVGFVGGLTGFGLALGLGAVAPNLIAVALAATCAGVVMAVLATRKELPH